MTPVILYTAQPGENSERISGVVDRAAGRAPVYRAESIDGMQALLRSHPASACVLVLMADTQDKLDEIEEIRCMLHNTRTILVLPDRMPATVSKGHALWPRFISYTDSDFSDVEAVLSQMLRRVPTTGGRDGLRRRQEVKA